MAADSLAAETPAVRHAIPAQQQRSRRSLANILNAAEALLREAGVDQLTIPAIAARSGVSVGGIYRRFSGKEAVLLAIKDRLLTESDEKVLGWSQRPHRTVRGAVRSFVAILVEDFRSQGELTSIILRNQAAYPALEARGHETVQRHHDAFVETLSRLGGPATRERTQAVEVAFFIILSTTSRRAIWAGGVAWSTLEREVAAAVCAYLDTTDRGKENANAT